MIRSATWNPSLVPLTIFYGRAIAPWIIPGLMVGLLGFGAVRRVNVYEAFVEGAKGSSWPNCASDIGRPRP